MKRNIKDLMNIIDQKAERDRKARLTKEELEMERWDAAHNKVGKLLERVDEIIELANYCEDKGITIPDSAKKYGFDADFFAEGIYHHVGFHRNGTKYITHLAIYNGGANGPNDLIVGQGNIKAVRGKDILDDTCIETKDLDKFYSEFIKFEAAFYKWVESLQEK